MQRYEFVRALGILTTVHAQIYILYVYIVHVLYFKNIQLPFKSLSLINANIYLNQCNGQVVCL